jgi:hypothetical protein
MKKRASRSRLPLHALRGEGGVRGRRRCLSVDEILSPAAPPPQPILLPAHGEKESQAAPTSKNGTASAPQTCLPCRGGQALSFSRKGASEERTTKAKKKSQESYETVASK